MYLVVIEAYRLLEEKESKTEDTNSLELQTFSNNTLSAPLDDNGYLPITSFTKIDSFPSVFESQFGNMDQFNEENYFASI
jgi:hypothetical protein